MKRLIMTLAALSTLTLAGCGESNDAPHKDIGVGEIYRTCFEGKVFVVLYTGFGAGVTQMWENSPNGPRPMICGQRERERSEAHE